MKRRIVVTSCVVLVVAVAAAVAAPPPPPSKQPANPVPQPAVTVIPRPDIDLIELRLTKVKQLGTMPDKQPCWLFNLQADFLNAGTANTGPFKVVWERADAEAGPYTVACMACTENIANLEPTHGMVPAPRQFNNCGGMKWYRVRVDPDNVVKESNENNNSKVIHF